MKKAGLNLFSSTNIYLISLCTIHRRKTDKQGFLFSLSEYAKIKTSFTCELLLGFHQYFYVP